MKSETYLKTVERSALCTLTRNFLNKEAALLT